MKRIIAIGALLCVTLANTEVLRAIHMHQHGGCQGAHDTSCPDAKHHPIGHHDPDKCPFCIQSGSAKTIPLGLTEPISSTAGPAEEPVFGRTFLLSAVFLPSSSPRAPPSASL